MTQEQIKRVEKGWRQPFMALFRHSSSKKKAQQDIKLRPTAQPLPEDVTLTTGVIKPRRKPFIIFYWNFILLSVLFVFSFCGTTVMWFTTIYQDRILNSLTLASGSVLLTGWKDPPLKPLLCIHILNYTNTKEYFSDENKAKKTIKLKVQDTGPYCFRETISRTNVTFINHGTELTYREKRTHVFDEAASNGTLNDTIIMPNVPIISVYKEVSGKLGGFILRTMGANMLTERTVNEYLFGYVDQLFNVIVSFKNTLSGGQAIQKEFGVLMKRAGLSNDTIAIRTGTGEIDDMGQVVEINKLRMYNTWTTPSCNLVTGSDGLFFRRSKVQSFSDVDLFHKDSCRALPLQYEKTMQVVHGIQVYRYKLRPDLFNYYRPENQCYCNATNSCHIQGVLDVSKCMGGAPIVISRPHFLDSNVNVDSDGNEIIEGLRPNLNEHSFHIDIFPPIGLTVRTLMRMQLNIMVHNPISDANLNPIKDKTVLPLVWVEMNSGDVPPKMVPVLYHITFTMRWLELALKLIFLLCLLVCAFFFYRMFIRRTKARKNFISVSIVRVKAKDGKSATSDAYVPN